MRVRQQVRQPVAQKLGVEHLLGIFPFIERLALVQALVALQAYQLAPGGGGPGFAQFGLAHAGGTFRQQRLAERFGQEEHRRDLVGGDVLLAVQGVANALNRFKHPIVSSASFRYRVGDHGPYGRDPPGRPGRVCPIKVNYINERATPGDPSSGPAPCGKGFTNL